MANDIYGAISESLQNVEAHRAELEAAAAIAPNVVHSMDAAHLCMVLKAAPFDIVPIHDSFACLPGRVDEMHRVLREQFVELYQHDVGAGLSESPVKGELKHQVPTPGDFDIRRVLDSRFVFC
jgi:DNA-directed RNA polymerase